MNSIAPVRPNKLLTMNWQDLHLTDLEISLALLEQYQQAKVCSAFFPFAWDKF